LKAVAEEEIRSLCVPVIIGDAQLLAHTARTLDLQCGYDIVRRGERLTGHLAEPVIFHLDNVGDLSNRELNRARLARQPPAISKLRSSYARPEASMPLPRRR